MSRTLELTIALTKAPLRWMCMSRIAEKTQRSGIRIAPMNTRSSIRLSETRFILGSACGLKKERKAMSEGRKFGIVAEIKVSLTQEDVDNIMVSALEGGINYWCRKAKVVEERRCGDWGHEQIARGGALILYDAESSDKMGTESGEVPEWRQALAPERWRPVRSSAKGRDTRHRRDRRRDGRHNRAVRLVWRCHLWIRKDVPE